MQQLHLAELPGSDAPAALKALQLAGLAWPASAAFAAVAWTCSPVVTTQELSMQAAWLSFMCITAHPTRTLANPQNASPSLLLKAASMPLSEQMHSATKLAEDAKQLCNYGCAIKPPDNKKSHNNSFKRHNNSFIAFQLADTHVVQRAAM